MTTDDALLWAREQYQRRTFSHLIPELAEAYRYGHAAGQSAAARVAELEAKDAEIARLTAELAAVKGERAQIVAWLRANRRGHCDPWMTAADAIEAGAHLAGEA